MDCTSESKALLNYTRDIPDSRSEARLPAASLPLLPNVLEQNLHHLPECVKDRRESASGKWQESASSTTRES